LALSMLELLLRGRELRRPAKLVARADVSV
jgi:hypothetical protein